MHDLGVLFVHGIGDQTRGKTLVDFGTPLIDWIKGRAEQLDGSAVLSRAILAPEGDIPAHADLVISHGDESRAWRLAETWWANSFAVRPFGELARWSFSIIPWTFGTHFGRRVQRAWAAPRKGRWKTILWLGNLTSSFLALLGGIALSVVMLVVFSLLLVLGLIPWQRLRAAIQRLQLRLASTMGDSFVFVQRAIESAGIIERFRRDIEWLRQECRRIAVVAHSQGGAVAVLALSRDLPERVGLLVTFGSGLRKLQELVLLQRARSLRRGAVLTTLGLVFVALSAIAVAAAVGSGELAPLKSPEAAIFAAYAIVGMALLIAGIVDFVSASDPQELRRLGQFFEDNGVVWHDIFASADPVPNGELFAGSGKSPTSTEVVNQGSMLRDHTSYWQNRDEFVGLVANALLKYDEPSIIAPVADSTLTHLQGRRRWRVRLLRAAGWIALTSSIAAAIKYWNDWWPVLTFATSYAVDRLVALLGGDFPVGVAPSSGQWARSVGWLAAILISYAVVRQLWSSNDKRVTEKPPPSRYEEGGQFWLVTALWFQMVIGAIALNGGNWISSWVFIGTLGLAFAVYFPGSTQRHPDQLASAETVESTPISRSDAVWRVLLIIGQFGGMLFGWYLAIVKGAPWARKQVAHFVPDPSWLLTAIVALAAFIVASLVMGSILWLVRYFRSLRTKATVESTHPA